MKTDPTALPLLEPSLAAVVAPHSTDEFLEHFWQREVFFCPGSPHLAQQLLAQLGAPSVPGLLWQSEHWAVLRAQSSGHRSERASMAGALQAYEKEGATLYCQMKTDWPLAKWAAALGHALGEPPTGIAAVFAVRAGNGTSAHFDWNENFTVQLLGSKTWRVAAGFVKHPVSNWRIGEPAPPYADTTSTPAEMPSDAQEFLLVPGSVLYVPRGHLHQATAGGAADSLSLNLSFPPTPWAVVLCALLSQRLMQDATFREGLVGAFGDGWGGERVRERLPAQMEKFCQNASEVGTTLLDMMRDPVKLQEYLAKKKLPKY